jgi:aspartate/methionine/tyrosine aminotransferase
MFLMAQARHRLARGKRPGPEGWISSNVAGIAVSAIKEMSILSARVPDVASLAWGLPSFRTPQNIRRVIQDALDKDPDIGKYTLPDGLPELRAAVAEEHRRSTGVTVDADRQVMISAGNMQALNAVLHAILDRDDEIILTDPGFASHFLQVILLVSPSNPTGSVFEEEELRQVVDIAAEHDLLVLLDDPYSFLTYEGDGKCFNLAAVDAHRERIVYCFTFSKSFAMSGWRVGYMILPEPIKKQVMKVGAAGRPRANARIQESPRRSPSPDLRKTGPGRSRI